MSNEPGWSPERPDRQRRPPQPPRESPAQPPPSQPPPPPPPHPPQPPQPPPPPPPQPNPPFQGRQRYGVPPGIPPPAPPPPGGPPPPGPSGEQVAPHISALLAYLFGWIGGLIIYLTQKDREVRFHAVQSILTFGGLAVLIAILSILNIGGSDVITTLILLLYILSFGLWIFLSIQGYQFKHTKLPMIGSIAERWSTK